MFYTFIIFSLSVKNLPTTYNKLTKTNTTKNFPGLRNDLKNAHYHRLGQHTNCDVYYCTGSNNALNSICLVQEAENSGMMRELQNIMSRLTINAESLIENKTNNLCEQFNSIINKHIERKRINCCGKRSYNTRVEAAVISFNSKQLLRKIHKKMCNNHSPGILFYN